jgi:hypothetical protein
MCLGAAALGAILICAAWAGGKPTKSAKAAAKPAKGGKLASRITEVKVDSMESPTLEGHAFGSSGKYEKLTGHFSGELDPNDPINAFIVNIDLAPRNAQGMVEYAADFRILKPV